MHIPQPPIGALLKEEPDGPQMSFLHCLEHGSAAIGIPGVDIRPVFQKES